jgi:hypothetical protein
MLCVYSMVHYIHIYNILFQNLKINLKFIFFIFKLYIYLLKFIMYWNIMDMLKNFKFKNDFLHSKVFVWILVGADMQIILQSLIIHIQNFIWISIDIYITLCFFTFKHWKMINPICEYIVSHLMWGIDGKGLAPFQIGPSIKIWI